MDYSKFPDPRYTRLGKCIQCGKCCLGEDCEYLGWEGEKAFCSIHPDRIGGEDKRPIKCPLYPEVPPLVFEGCGYYFMDNWEDGRIIRGRNI